MEHGTVYCFALRLVTGVNNGDSRGDGLPVWQDFDGAEEETRSTGDKFPWYLECGENRGDEFVEEAEMTAISIWFSTSQPYKKNFFLKKNLSFLPHPLLPHTYPHLNFHHFSWN